MWCGVDAEIPGQLKFRRLPATLIGELHRRLVLELRIPALGQGGIDDAMNEILRLMRKRCRANHAEAERCLIEHRTGPRHHADRAIEPAGIRPVIRRRIAQQLVGRRIHALAQRVFNADIALGIEHWQLQRQVAQPWRLVALRRQIGETNAIGVTPVGVIEEIVLQHEAPDCLPYPDRGRFASCAAPGGRKRSSRKG